MVQLAEPEASATFLTCVRSVGQHERRQVVHRRLVIADGREHARQRDFDRAFIATMASIFF